MRISTNATGRSVYSVLIIVFVVLCQCLCGSRVFAQSVEDVHNFATWSQEVSGKYQQGVNIVSELANAELTIHDLMNGDVSTRVAERLVFRSILDAERKAEEFRLSLDEFPDLNAKHFEYTMIASEFKSYLATIPDFIDRQIDLIKDMFFAALTGDEEKYNDLSSLTVSRYISLLQGENHYLRITLVTITKGNPNGPLVQCIISLNKAIIESLEFTANALSMGEVDVLRTSNDMQEHLEEARDSLILAEESVGPFGANLRSLDGVTISQAKLVYDIENSIRRSISIERGLADEITSIAHLIAQSEDLAESLNEAEFDEYLAEFDRAYLLVDEFVQRRLEEQERRAEIIQSLMREFM